MVRLLLTLLFLDIQLVTQAQQCDIIYVTPTGATSGAAGTVSNPADINYAVQLLTPSIRRIYLAVGNYKLSSTFQITANNVTFEGGFDPANGWAKTNVLKTVVLRDTNNFLPSPNRIVAISAVNTSGLVVQDVTIIVDNAKTMGRSMSTYGIYLSGCSNYRLTRVNARAGDAGSGDKGQDGAKGADGAPGGIGQPGQDDGNSTGPNLGGAGGVSWSGGFFAGGKGGDGGQKGNVNYVLGFIPTSATAFNGQPGQAAPGAPSAPGGSPGQRFESLLQFSGCINNGQQNMNGGNGQDGISGLGVFDNPPAFNGLQGVATHAGGFFQPGTGADGVQGQPGRGGGGGGGGGSASYPQVAQLQSITSTGAGGGGGGEGGQGGFPGTGGGGGGGSFGLYINSGGTGGKLTDCKFESGLPGIGNLGGAGGVGGVGGLGGFGGAQGLNGQPSACQQGAGGNGGKGGNGGAGGNGGKGADGVSFPYYISPSTPFGSIDSLIQGKPNEPTITAYFNGCSEKDVTFEALASGSVTWFFGAGANPVSATGSIAKVRYSTLGRKTVTALINGEFFTLTEFIDIRSSGAGLTPAIVSTADTVCTGTPALFSSSISAENFEWTFGGAFPDESGTTVNSVTQSFTTPGNYIVTLRTYTSCCGFSDIDTFRVFVRPNPVTSVSIQTQDGQTTYCQGQTVTFVATAVNPGVAPVYTWLVNGVPVPNGPNSAVFLTNSLNSGDIVSVRLTVTNNCVSGQVFNSNIVVIQTNTPPVLVPEANGNCFGVSTLNGRFAPNEAVQFSANATGGAGGYTFLWSFGNGASGIGQNTSCIYTQPGRYVVRVQVVDQFGCSSEGSGNVCSDTVEIFNYARAAFIASNVEGCAPLTVQFDNQSQNALSYLWNFGNGTPTDITKNPTRTFTSPGTYDVTLQAFGSFVNDTSFVRSQIVVHPRPVADFVALPTFASRSDDTVKFGAASLDAITWRWDFGDPASGDLNTSTVPNPVHFYAQEGEYTVTLVVENAFGCKDSITKVNYIQKKILLGRPSLTFPEVSLYPNPFSESFTLRLASSSGQPYTVELLAVTGQVLEIWQSHAPIVQCTPQRLTGAGVYFVRLTTEQQSIVYPIIYNNR